MKTVRRERNKESERRNVRTSEQYSAVFVKKQIEVSDPRGILYVICPA